jgi:hypothetical protein
VSFISFLLLGVYNSRLLISIPLHKAFLHASVYCLFFYSNQQTMRSLILSALIATVSSSHISLNQELQYSFCEGADQPFTIDEFTVEPYPIEVYTGSIINLALGITLNEPIPVGATISIKTVKDLLIDMPVPCLDLGDFYFGSW